MRYKLDLSPKFNVLSPSVTGSIVSATAPTMFVAWQPSTWPPTPLVVDDKFVFTLKSIFEESMLGEISNVIGDVHKSNGDLQHRGHVVAIALMCALDAIASYGYRKRHVSDFIKAHFRPDYHPHADQIYELYRCSLIHSWNLFMASICPNNTKIKLDGKSLTLGLLDLFECLVAATEDFLEKLTYNPALQKNALERYEELRNTARP